MTVWLDDCETNEQSNVDKCQDNAEILSNNGNVHFQFLKIVIMMTFNTITWLLKRKKSTKEPSSNTKPFELYFTKASLCKGHIVLFNIRNICELKNYILKVIVTRIVSWCVRLLNQSKSITWRTRVQRHWRSIFMNNILCKYTLIYLSYRIKRHNTKRKFNLFNIISIRHKSNIINFLCNAINDFGERRYLSRHFSTILSRNLVNNSLRYASLTVLPCFQI